MRFVYFVSATVVLIALAEVFLQPGRERQQAVALVGVNVIPMDSERVLQDQTPCGTAISSRGDLVAALRC